MGNRLSYCGIRIADFGKSLEDRGQTTEGSKPIRRLEV